VVARIGQTTRDTAHEMRDQLDRLDVPVLGIVANVIKVRGRSRYGYGYYGPAGQGEPMVDRPEEPHGPSRLRA